MAQTQIASFAGLDKSDGDAELYGRRMFMRRPFDN